jgi:hypothetical protein
VEQTFYYLPPGGKGILFTVRQETPPSAMMYFQFKLDRYAAIGTVFQL